MPDIMVKKFSDLSVDELYDILQLRSAIFVVEQNCVYQDCDGHDKQATHLMMYDNINPVAYARILPPAIKYPQASIGRVVVQADSRGKNLARQMMERAIQETRRLFPAAPILVQAQHYLERFYESFGFKTFTDVYDEDGIPHVDMVML